MMTLNMVIIASMIGAGGLGFDVLRALRRLDIGGGACEAGLGIVVIAVVSLDSRPDAGPPLRRSRAGSTAGPTARISGRWRRWSRGDNGG